MLTAADGRPMMLRLPAAPFFVKFLNISLKPLIPILELRLFLRIDSAVDTYPGGSVMPVPELYEDGKPAMPESSSEGSVTVDPIGSAPHLHPRFTFTFSSKTLKVPPPPEGDPSTELGLVPFPVFSMSLNSHNCLCERSFLPVDALHPGFGVFTGVDVPIVGLMRIEVGGKCA